MIELLNGFTVDSTQNELLSLLAKVDADDYDELKRHLKGLYDASCMINVSAYSSVICFLIMSIKHEVMDVELDQLWE